MTEQHIYHHDSAPSQDQSVLTIVFILVGLVVIAATTFYFTRTTEVVIPRDTETTESIPMPPPTPSGVTNTGPSATQPSTPDPTY